MKPTINKGLGALTPETWGEIYASVQNSRRGDRTRDDYANRDTRFLAEITGNLEAVVGRARWKYSWQEVRRLTNASFNYSMPENALSGSTSTNFAVNVLELANTTGTAYGYYVTARELQDADGYFFNPVPNGTIVEMIMRRSLNGSLVYEFIAPNPITGSCPAGIVQELDGGEYGAS
jgi:hypothetical protein